MSSHRMPQNSQDGIKIPDEQRTEFDQGTPYALKSQLW